MSGMGSGIGTNNSVIVSAFQHALLRQGLIAVGLLVVVLLVWNVLRGVQMRRAVQAGRAAPVRPMVTAEPAARRLLRISFGLIWVFDGILQGQASMPLGLVPDGIQPAATASPSWVQHVVAWGTNVWSYHPVSAAAAAVWVQVGIGLWLLVAPRGTLSRLGGVASFYWGLLVWVFGEAFGGIFAPGSSWLFGTPGAVLFYCAAGLLIAFPNRWWSKATLGRWVLRVMGVFFVGMAVLQAWPGRGFWQGGSAGSVSGMAQQMAQTPQPHAVSSMVASFADFASGHGWAVNLFVVVALAAIGTGLATARPRPARVAVAAGVVLCLATWVLVQDLGFMGGVGTDPNSMIPMALVLLAGYMAMTRVPPPVTEAVVPIDVNLPLRQRLAANPSFVLRALATVAAFGVVLIGVVPMTVDVAHPHADPILAEAVDGPPLQMDKPATGFDLLDQEGRPVTLSDLRGKVVALTFLDDVCTSACPIIAQEFKAVDSVLGSASRRVDLVAVNANPRFLSTDYLVAFDRQEAMTGLPNWNYLTGSLRQLQSVWAAYGISVDYEPAGSMIAHSLYAYVIGPGGNLRFLLDTDPGPGTPATRSSFTVTLASSIRKTLRAS